MSAPHDLDELYQLTRAVVDEVVERQRLVAVTGRAAGKAVVANAAAQSRLTEANAIYRALCRVAVNDAGYDQKTDPAATIAAARTLLGEDDG